MAPAPSRPRDTARMPSHSVSPSVLTLPTSAALSQLSEGPLAPPGSGLSAFPLLRRRVPTVSTFKIVFQSHLLRGVLSDSWARFLRFYHSHVVTISISDVRPRHALFPGPGSQLQPGPLWGAFRWESHVSKEGRSLSHR